MNTIGIDIGGTFIKYGVVNQDGEILNKDKVATPKDKEEFLITIDKIYNDLRNKYDISGLGISIPGIIKDDGYLISAGSVGYLKGLNLKQELKKNINVKINIENDANAAALSELWKGSGKNYKNFVVLSLGTAIGGSVFINGELYRGKNGMAGEFGMVLTNLKELYSAKQYVFKEYSLAAGVVAGLCKDYTYEKLKQEGKIDSSKTFDQFTKEEIYKFYQQIDSDASKISQKVQDKDPLATEVFNKWILNVAVGLVNIGVIYDSEAIILSGGITNEKFVMEKIKEEYQKVQDKDLSIASSEIEMPSLLVAEFKNDAGMVGATYYLNQENKNN